MRPRVAAVAFSGGRDSTALLHATVHAAAGLNIEVVALHVHHGLHRDADAWLAHCERLCARWARRGLPLRFAAERLDGSPAAAESIEAWARIGRYRALGRLARAHQASIVLLGQHRRDQAETFLLQALRGGSAAGLAGMPLQVERDGLVWARPWLQQPREGIEAYVRRHRLRFIDDPSNDDTRFARNRLRKRVWPALLDAFGQAETSLADAAALAAQARQLADEVAAEDLLRIGADNGSIDIAEWRALPAARRTNVLLAWLRGQSAASASLMQRLSAELPRAGSSARWPLGGGRELCLYRGRLCSRPSSLPGPAASRAELLRIAGAGRFEVKGWGGSIVAHAARQGGAPHDRLSALRVVARAGGEQFQCAPGGQPRSLKKQFQALGVAPWRREGPLLFDGDQLVFVPELGVDARVQAADGEPQLALSWVPDR